MKKAFTIMITACTLVLALLSGCKSGDYDRAMDLYKNGNYEEAAEAFQGLGDYEDSAQMAVACTYEAAKARYDAEDYAGAITLFQSVGTYEDSADRIADAQHLLMLQTYAEPIERLCKRSWFFYGGSDAALNRISFTKGAATIRQLTYDGNGPHDGGSNDFSYVIDDANITLTLADGSELAIPYKMTKKGINIGTGEYLTQKQVEQDLQGHWMLRQSDNVLGYSVENEYHIIVRDGRVTYEHAAKALNRGPGEYYYYDPDEGTYGIDDRGFHSEVDKIAWGFNIVDGKAILMHYDHPMNKVESDALPGQDGYSF